MAHSAVFGASAPRILSLPEQVERVVMLARTASLLKAGASRWSLAELNLSASDLASIDATVCEMSASFWERTLSQLEPMLVRSSQINIPDFPSSEISTTVSRRAGAGLILLIWMVAKVRLKSESGSLWACLFPSALPRRAQHILFSSQRNGSPALFSALEDAVRTFRLRHRLYDPNSHRWYNTCSLQFGIPKKSIEMLPLWLDGAPRPIAVASLLGADTQLNSVTFAKVWEALVNFRKAPNSPASIRQFLKGNPWIPENWIGLVIDALESVPHWANTNPGTTRTVFAPTSAPTTPSPATDDESTLLAPPCVGWPVASRAPSFSSRLILPLSCAGDPPDLVLDLFGPGGRMVRLLRTTPTAPFVPTSQAPLPLGLLSSVSVVLRARDGQDVMSQEIQCWDDTTAFQWFALDTGQPAPNNKPLSDQDHLLIADSGLQVTPTDLPVHTTAGRSFYRVAANQRSIVQIHDGPQLIWSHAPIAVTPPILEQISATVARRATAAVPQVDLTLTLPNNVSLRKVSAPSGPMTDAAPGHWTAPVLPSDLQPTLPVRVDVEVAGRVFRLQRALESFEGAVFQPPDGQASFLTPETEVDSDDAFAPYYRTLSPASHQQSSTLLAGDLIVSRRSTRRARLGALPGHGEPLVLLEGPPFSGQRERGSSTREIAIGRAVTRRGLLLEVARETNRWVATLRSEIELDPEHHAFVAWHRNGSISLHSFSQAMPSQIPSRIVAILDAGVDPQGNPCPLTPDLRAVSLVYKSTWLGSWRSDDWSVGVADLDSPLGTANAIRWFRTPLLHPVHRTNILELLRRHTEATCRSWFLSTDFLAAPRELKMPYGDDAWDAALRRLMNEAFSFEGGRADKASHQKSTEILDALGDVTDEEGKLQTRRHLPTAVDRLAPLGARFLTRFLAANITEAKQVGSSDFMALRAIGTQENYPSNRRIGVLRKVFRGLVETAAFRLNVPPTRVLELIELVPVEAPDARRALGIYEFRQVAAFRLLGESFAEACVYP